MRTLHSRLVPAAAAVAVLLGACGGDDPSAASVEPPDTSIAAGLRAPTSIRVSGDGEGRAVGAATAEVAATDMMIAPSYVVADYVVGPGMPALPSNTTGYVFDVDAGSTPAEAASVATALGLSGDPVRADDGFSGWWRVGPDDGTAPSLTLWDDAMHSWNYDWGWVGRDERVACAVAGEPAIEPATVDAVEPDGEAESPSADAETQPVEPPPAETEPVELPPAETIVPVEPCPEPEPPVGLPTEAEAQARVTEMLTTMGVDIATIRLESFVDQWSASVNVTETLDGVAARTWGFTFGANAELQYAWGSAAAPEPVGPYGLVDLDTAVARLQDGSFGYGGMGRVAPMEDLAVSSDEAVSSDVAVPDVPPATELPEPMPEPMPVDLPEGEPIAPEEITVTLVDVQPDLWWVWDVDGSAWLLPAYRFVGDDGGWYTVPAVTDDLLIVEEPPPATDPAVDVTAPVPPSTTPPTDPPTDPPTTSPPAGSVPTAEEIGPLVGSSLDEFTAAAAAYPVRVVEIDGIAQPVTEDFSVSRINVAVVGDGGVQYVVRATTDDGTLLGEADVPGVTVMTIASVVEGVAYYPACGNEILDLDGTLWYPIDPDSAPDLYQAAVTSVERETWEAATVSGLARVVPPGPGDDTGTFILYSDGIARFVSDSGDLDVWLTTEQITYDWVC